MAKIGTEEKKYLDQVLSNRFRTSYNGYMVNKLEDRVKSLYNKKYAIAHCNGTATLHTALLAAGVGVGDFVITTPLTMSSPSIAIRLCGATPIYVDVNPVTWNLDFTQVKRKYLAKAKAIIGVSLYGLPCDFDWYNKHLKPGFPKVVTINDSAEQLAPFDCGADIISLSYQASKQLSCGEGGMILTDREDLADAIRQYSNLGYPIVKFGGLRNNIKQFHAIRHEVLGFNYRMSDLQAAVMLGQYETTIMKSNLDARVESAQNYNEEFRKYPEFTPQCNYNEVLTKNHSYWTYAVDCGEFASKILANGFLASELYPVWELAYKEPALKMDCFCPVAERLSKSILQYPTHYSRSYGKDLVETSYRQAHSNKIKEYTDDSLVNMSVDPLDAGNMLV